MRVGDLPCYESSWMMSCSFRPSQPSGVDTCSTKAGTLIGILGRQTYRGWRPPNHARVRVPSSRSGAGAFSRNASTATTRRWTGAAEMPSLLKIALTCFSTVDSERNRACSMPALVLPWAISRRTSSSRGVRDASGLDARSLSRDQGVDDQRIDDRSPGRHLIERADQVLKITDAILEQVCQTCGAVIEERSGVALICVLRQHHDADPGVLGTDGAGSLDALHMVTGRHADIGENRAWGESPYRIEQLARITDAGYDLDLPGVFQQTAYAFAYEVVVLGDDDPELLRHPDLRPSWQWEFGTDACSGAQPAFDRELAVQRLDAVTDVGQPAGTGAVRLEPRPSSSTTRQSRLLECDSRTRAPSVPACLATLVKDSQATK